MQISTLFFGPALARAVRDRPYWAAGAGVAMVISGVLSLLSPAALGVAAMVTVGILLIIGGAGQCIWAIQTGSRESGWLIFTLGAIAVIAGCYLVFQPITALSPVIVLVACYFALTGIGTIIHAFAIQSSDGWLWLLGAGVLSLLLVILIIAQWPLSGVWAVGVLIGLQLISGGVSLVRLVVTRDIARKIVEMDR